MFHYSPALHFPSSASGGSDITRTFLTFELKVTEVLVCFLCMFHDFKGKGNKPKPAVT